MEDYDLLSFRDIKKLLTRQIKEERHKLEPERYKPKKYPKINQTITTNDCQHILANSDKGWAFTQKDLFYGYKKEISLTKTQQRNLGLKKDIEIEEIFGNIFFTFVLYVIKDIILNNITFKVSTVGAFADIHMRCLNREEFTEGRQQGKYMDIDFLASNFKTYRPTLYIYDRQDSSKIHTVDIILDKSLQQELSNKINNGKVYYESTPKSIDEYLNDFQYLYPNIKLQLLKSILVFGWRQIYFHGKLFRDVFLSNNNHYIYIGNVESYEGNKPLTYYKRQLRKKLQKLFITKNIQWDGYYYFCLTKDEYNYYFRPTIKMKRRWKMNSNRAQHTKYFFFKYNKLLFKHPDLAYIYYTKSKYMVRAKVTQDYGNFRFIRPYIPILNVELYEYKGVNNLDNICTTNHKYEIIWAKKQR